jgi:hypothetical protein
MGKDKLPVTVLGLSLVALLLLSSSVVQDAAAMQGSLNYHMMAADQENGRNKDLFRPGANANANAYTRGCEATEGCRGMR